MYRKQKDSPPTQVCALSVAFVRNHVLSLTSCIVVGIYATPDETNFRHFHVQISGPADTPYNGGMFKAELFLPDEYPMVPPKVLFRTKIFHPNIDKLGAHPSSFVVLNLLFVVCHVRSLILVIRQNLSGYPEEELVTSFADQSRLGLHSEFAERRQPRRPTRRRSR